MHTVVSLTVSESKRLIGKGFAQTDFVQRTINEGVLAIGSGTTNGYVVEEITGERFDRKTFVTGRTLPATYDGPKLSYEHPDLVYREGERLSVKALDMLDEMGAGDIFVKGVNAINYDRGQSGVLIGHPTGGGVGTALGTVVARRIRYFHPVGLEKNMGCDLDAVAAQLNRDSDGKGPTLWVVPGDIFTEIEALHVLSGVTAIQVASGGVGGAEGAVWLGLYGDNAQIDKALATIESVRGEPPFPQT